MRISDMLTAISAWLESPNNEAIMLAEYHPASLQIVAENLVLAAALLKTAAEEVQEVEPLPDSLITSDSIQDIANLAAALDSSGDPDLKKQASVLDELLLSIAAPPNASETIKKLQDNRLEELQKKYQKSQETLEKSNKIADAEEAIDKSDALKKNDIQNQGLSSRYCPDHSGVQIARIGEHQWQCELDKKIYNYETGFSLYNGVKVPGGDVAMQTDFEYPNDQSMFDTREGRLGSNR